MRTELCFQRKLRRMLVAVAIVGPVALTPEMSAAEGLLDFFSVAARSNRPRLLIRNHHSRGRSSQARDLPSACAVATANIFR
jgi:hypothetical protein